MSEIDELSDLALARTVAQYVDGVHVPAEGAPTIQASIRVDGLGEMGLCRVEFRPDRDIAQAWGLLKGYVYAIENYELRPGALTCYLHPGNSGETFDDVIARADTAPVAICRAYLKAQGWTP